MTPRKQLNVIPITAAIILFIVILILYKIFLIGTLDGKGNPVCWLEAFVVAAFLSYCLDIFLAIMIVIWNPLDLMR